MNILDIILLVLLVIAAIIGWRKGIIVQACGIAGLVLGIMFAMRFSRSVGIWLGLSDAAAAVIGFIIILVVCIIVLALVGYLFKKIFRLTGFGILDRIGGALLGAVKAALLTGILMGFFVRMNDSFHIIDNKQIEDSVVYKPLQSITDAMFPYLERLKDGLSDNTPE